MEKQWNSQAYDQSFNFVSKFGEGMLSYLNPQPGEKILDLGCGTGDLAQKIRESGAEVAGVDHSERMIHQAREKYPEINFQVQDATALDFDSEFDAIFSNAVLHWVTDYDKAIQSMHQSLKTGGRLTFEFGGKHNNWGMVEALKRELTARGYQSNTDTEWWYFPSIGEYAAALEKHNFRVIHAEHFDRDTPLTGHDGMKDWFRMFGDYFFKGISMEEKEEILEKIQNDLKPDYFIDGQWIADYKRLRVVAIKN